MDRKEKLLSGLSIEGKLGLEIGALCRPFIKDTEHHVIYADHASTEALREKYRPDPDVDIDQIVGVTAILGEGSLAHSVGKTVDYVVASHVIEHVPNLIGWLNELCSILNEGGEIRLVVPDKRFTFDYLRATTRLSDVLYADLVKARFPMAHIVMDYVLNVVKLDGGKAWRSQIKPGELERHHTLRDAQNIAQQILSSNAYHDVHCWVFTPQSMAQLFVELTDHRLVELECVSFHDTAQDTIEFFVGMRHTKDFARARQSWLSMAEAAKHVQTQAR
ncbi:methyltransferase domain-containing protein [Pseudomonas sp. G.S.17]|uniref:methyltransferase domain-containing protein n=1 Tax=Pseudomonas sp. G.S.17 TaxID=3137451 RepID=UPI00311CBA6F